jgi:hypothetical protein
MQRSNSSFRSHWCWLCSFPLHHIHSYQVFISFRIEEAGDAPDKLKAALERRGVTSFVSTQDSTSLSIADDVAEALDVCKVFVILGTETYGKKTDIGFATYNELLFACDRDKPRYLIKMLDGEFKVPTTLLRLPKDMPFKVWRPGTDLPPEILDGLCAMCQRL